MGAWGHGIKECDNFYDVKSIIENNLVDGSFGISEYETEFLKIFGNSLTYSNEHLIFAWHVVYNDKVSITCVTPQVMDNITNAFIEEYRKAIDYENPDERRAYIRTLEIAFHHYWETGEVKPWPDEKSLLDKIDEHLAEYEK